MGKAVLSSPLSHQDGEDSSAPLSTSVKHFGEGLQVMGRDRAE